MPTRKIQQEETLACPETRLQSETDTREIERRMRWPHPLDTGTLVLQITILTIVVVFLLTV